MAENNKADAKQPKQDQKNNQSNDEQTVKIMSVLAYFGILFFLPLVVTPDSKFGKFHANQGLLLLLLGIVSQVLWLIPIIGWILIPFVSLATLVFFIMGIVNALNGKMKRLPIIGGYDLIT
ncbi:MAG: hypothetical protein U5L95_04185 [Candidatus Saccharibacteria bacterium]|nr:hypothetical protein [Candidatus Saccharibacteria bacterium]